ncbi:MAG: NHL repeat-containing protein [Gemmataceae bacterium]|nr:NHL repeat-containing protein [Gemmataceae bacterium]
MRPRPARTAALATVLVALLTATPTRADFTLYVANLNTSTISRVDAGGGVTPFASAGLDFALGVTVDAAGNVYATSDGNNQIRRYSPAGADLGVFATLPGSAGGLVFGPDGNLYVAGWYGNLGEVRSVSPAGADLGVFAFRSLPFNEFGGGLAVHTGLAFGPDGNLFATDSFFGKLYKYSPAGADLGAYSRNEAGNPPGVPGIGSAFGVAIGPDGNVYVSDLDFGRIYRLSQDLEYLGVFASITGTATGLAFGPDGNLYVANYDLGTIRRFAPDGTDLGDFATGLTGPAFIAFAPAAVPEPASVGLLAAGGLGLLGYARQRRTTA